MRVVFDTNIFISAFEFGGVPRAALLLASAGWFELCTSGALLAELERVLRDRFEYSEEMLREVGTRLRGLCMVVEPTEEITACGDSEDNRLLECAVIANAGAIVSGDRAQGSLPTSSCRTAVGICRVQFGNVRCSLT